MFRTRILARILNEPFAAFITSLVTSTFIYRPKTLISIIKLKPTFQNEQKSKKILI